MRMSVLVVPCLLGGALVLTSCQGAPGATSETPVERGKFLVGVGGCNDCHTPLKMGANGPEPDFTRMLSGHPEALKMPPAPTLPPGPWMFVGSATMTAWSGPWGVSYTANLTPDPETGIGAWDDKMFTQAMRTGKHLGGGRDILPPMPWQAIGKLSDDDLKAIFAYLKSIPPIKNHVPDPLPSSGPPPAT
jgi:mono/diheme cytochrome c family protein